MKKLLYISCFLLCSSIIFASQLQLGKSDRGKNDQGNHELKLPPITLTYKKHNNKKKLIISKKKQLPTISEINSYTFAYDLPRPSNVIDDNQRSIIASRNKNQTIFEDDADEKNIFHFTQADIAFSNNVIDLVKKKKYESALNLLRQFPDSLTPYAAQKTQTLLQSLGRKKLTASSIDLKLLIDDKVKNNL